MPRSWGARRDHESGPALIGGHDRHMQSLILISETAASISPSNQAEALAATAVVLPSTARPGVPNGPGTE